jgi:hypothetical protein
VARLTKPGFWIRRCIYLTLTSLTILYYNLQPIAPLLFHTVCSSLHTHWAPLVCCPFTSPLVPASNGRCSTSWVPKLSPHHSWLIVNSVELCPELPPLVSYYSVRSSIQYYCSVCSFIQDQIESTASPIVALPGTRLLSVRINGNAFVFPLPINDRFTTQPSRHNICVCEKEFLKFLMHVASHVHLIRLNPSKNIWCRVHVHTTKFLATSMNPAC